MKRKEANMMNAAYVYLQIYKLFDFVTPVKADCGGLCDKACCKGDDSGMLLFPGEEEVFKLLNPDGIKIEKTELKYEFDGKERTVYLATCDGKCDRFQRPLSCRIFPLTPYLTADGKLEIIIDPRGKGICPMAKALYLEDFDGAFVRNIRRAFTLLMKNVRFKSFMKMYSEYLDEFRRFYD